MAKVIVIFYIDYLKLSCRMKSNDKSGGRNTLSISEVEEILPRYQEIANGSKKEFSVAFDLIDIRFVSVYVGSEKQSSGYTINIQNRKVTFDSAPETNKLITIVRAVPVSWESTLHGAINSQSLNSLLSHIVASIQTVQEEVDRAVKSNVYDKVDGGQLSEFFLKQITDAKDILDSAENTLSLLNTTMQSALTSVETARAGAVSDINMAYQKNLNDLNSAGSTAISNVNSAKDSAVTTINTLIDSAEVSEVNASRSATAAKTSETNAKTSETNAQRIVDSIIDNAANQDLNNLTEEGQAKFDAKQTKLVSGTNIKTINGVSILGSGNFELDMSSRADVNLSNLTSAGNAVISNLVNTQVDNKIKTVNSLPSTVDESIIYLIPG